MNGPNSLRTARKRFRAVDMARIGPTQQRGLPRRGPGRGAEEAVLRRGAQQQRPAHRRAEAAVRERQGGVAIAVQSYP